MLNALEIQGKDISEAKLVCLGAGAAAFACCKLLITAGMQPENIAMIDRKGVIHSGRTDLTKYKQEFAIETNHRTLDDAIEGADVFLGLSGPDYYRKTVAKWPSWCLLVQTLTQKLLRLLQAVRDDLF